MDCIEIRGLRAFGHHGVFEEERRQGQPFLLDVAIEVDMRAAARSDALADTVDYGTLAERLAGAVADTQFRLLEALAGHLSDIVLTEPLVSAVEIRVAKPRAPVAVQLDEVSVTLRRTRHEAQ